MSSRGQYHVHQQHQYHQQPPQQQQQSQFHQQQQHHHHHHHHHQLLQGQGQAGPAHRNHGGQYAHSHSRHSHTHERSAGSRDAERRDSSDHHHHHHGSLPGAFTMATGGETPYGVLQPQQHVGGFVMGTDLRTPTPPTSGGWYHEQQPEVPQVQSVKTSSLESPVPRSEESTVPKDSGIYRAMQ
jgi:hypothetical protein